jgi:ubiquinone/menaquinone biosynthesis C-methylase UbiE
MAEIGHFTQPDSSPAYFVDFLDFLDSQPEIARLRGEAAARLHLAAGAKVVDVGCGIGGATFPLHSLTGSTGQVVGLDISTALVGVAAGRVLNQAGIEFRTADACAIPYPDHYFDAARSERVFLYLPDRLAAIREMMRVTRPGGRVVLLDTDVDCTAIHSTNPRLTRKMTSLVAESMPNPCSARELPSLARQAGLNDVTTETFCLTTPYEFLLKVMPGSLYQAAERGLVARAEVEEWLDDMAQLNARGEFLQMWHFALVSGTV